MHNMFCIWLDAITQQDIFCTYGAHKYVISISVFSDYSVDETPLQFIPMMSQICRNITPVTDSIIENAEEFMLQLDITGQPVVVQESMATVIINDSTSK